MWTALGLDRCANDDGEVPVLITGGKGTADEPYSVTTVQFRPGRPAQSFNVVGTEIAVRLPTPVTVTVSN